MLRPAGLPAELSERGETLVMGILNVTPDSFSDGGLHDRPEQAVAHARAMRKAGADVIDVGGESTRPGAARVPEAEELRRVVPVVAALAAEGACVSVDTMRASVAAAALEAGAIILNDVSGGLADAEMAPLAARARTSLGTPPVFVAMHWRGHSTEMAARAHYQDTVSEVLSELGERIAALEAAGVDREQLVADPGLGFAKNHRHDWDLLGALEALASLELPLLIGASRKRFLRALEVDADQATAAVSALVAAQGAWCVRVHDVASSAAAVRVASMMRGPR